MIVSYWCDTLASLLSSMWKIVAEGALCQWSWGGGILDTGLFRYNHRLFRLKGGNRSVGAGFVTNAKCLLWNWTTISIIKDIQWTTQTCPCESSNWRQVGRFYEAIGCLRSIEPLSPQHIYQARETEPTPTQTRQQYRSYLASSGFHT